MIDRPRGRGRAALEFAVCALALLGAGRAAASGEGIPDLGTEALGEGSAQIASPRNLSALWLNPAGLAGVTDVQLQFDFRLPWHRVQFQRLDADGGNREGFEPVANAGGVALTAAAPLCGIAWPLHALPFPSTIALGGFPFNGATGYQYPDPRALAAAGYTSTQIEQAAPQRYSSILSASKIYVAAAAFSIRPLDWLDLGAELQLANASFGSTQAVASGVIGGEDPDFDAVLDIHAHDYLRPSGAFGLTVRLPEGLAIGLSYQLPYRFHASGNLGATLSQTLQELGADLEGSQANISLTLPWYLRGGIRFSRPAWEVELAGTVDGWSTLDNIRISSQGIYVVLGGKKTALPTLILPQQLTNAGSARLGGELHLGAITSWGQGLTVRAGLLYESSAVPEERQNVSLPNWARASVSIGATYELSRYSIAVAWAHFIQPDRDVFDSTVKQTVALPGNAPTVVGDGIYSSQLDLFSLSLGVKL